jgi:hypothetical protein
VGPFVANALVAGAVLKLGRSRFAAGRLRIGSSVRKHDPRPAGIGNTATAVGRCQAAFREQRHGAEQGSSMPIKGRFRCRKVLADLVIMMCTWFNCLSSNRSPQNHPCKR